MSDVADKVITKKGILYGVGIGPGDPDLLTVKAVKILKKVDCVFTPQANSKAESLAANIIKDIVDEDKVRPVVFPMIKDEAVLKKFWEQAAAKVYEELSLGRDAAFVTLGDPFVYSTYIYLLRNLNLIDPTLEIVTVPGISAVNAASSLVGVPLGAADEKFAVVPLPTDLNDLKQYFKLFDTVVLMKIGKSLGPLVTFIKQEGLSERSFFARKIGSLDQYVVKGLDSLSQETSGYFSIMIVRTNRQEGEIK